MQPVSPPARVGPTAHRSWGGDPGGRTGARILDGDRLELPIELLGLLRVGEVVGLGARDRRRCHHDRGELRDGHGNYCHRGRGRWVREIHRYVCPLD